MQAAFKYRETTAFDGMESEPLSSKLSSIGALKIKGADE